MTEHFPTGYDLKNELGPNNDYDKIAGEAYLVGTEYHNRELVNLGTQLADLIRKIPYDHDHFYKVIVLAEQISEKIKVTKAVEDIVMEELKISSTDTTTYRLVLGEKQGLYSIQLDNWRGASISNQALQEKVEALLEKEIEKKIDRSKTEKNEEKYGLSRTETTSFFNKNGFLLKKAVFQVHEDGCSTGFLDIYYFKDKEEILALWERIKQQLKSI